MMYGVFTFLDHKTGHFSPPFYMAHDGQAVRAAQEVAQDLSTTIGRHPHDFTLVKIGEWNDQSGEHTNTGNVGLGTVASFLPARQVPLPFPPGPETLTMTREQHEARRAESSPNGRGGEG